MADWEKRRSSEWKDHSVYLNPEDYERVVVHAIWLVLAGYMMLVVPLPLLFPGAFVCWWHGREVWRTINLGKRKPPTR